MDYEKKYTEALEDMRVIYPNLKGDAKLAVEHAFPELRESEDERINKAIFKALSKKEAMDVLLAEGVQVSDALAYLEKQEQKPAWSEEDEAIIKFLEWMVGNHCWMGGVSRESVVRFLKSLRPQPKQMPADWTDKDKRILDDISHLLITFNYTEMAKAYKQAIEKLLYSRPSFKPSEEQMEALESATENCAYSEYQDCLRELIKQLKKL